jgi:hypothetical protein
MRSSQFVKGIYMSVGKVNWLVYYLHAIQLCYLFNVVGYRTFIVV